MKNLITRSAIALLCGAFVLGGLCDDADAKRRRRKSKVVKKAEAAQKKAEQARKLAEDERNTAEAQRAAAQDAAAVSKREADEAKRQLEQIRTANATTTAGDSAGFFTDADSAGAAGARADGPLWGGFFLSFNMGYATAGGAPGPTIPDPSNGYKTNLTPGLLRATNFSKYSEAITTDVGAGFAVDFQIGYNIAGYVSLWADVSGHGSCCAKSDQAGAVAGAVMVGVHPLRFWRPDAPAAIKVYAGYGIFEFLGYHETVFQAEATGKAWFGSMIPFGLSAEYRIPKSVFAMGVDLRFVSASYDRWIYNYDEDMKSDLGTAEFPAATTFRIEPRVIFGWHF